LRRADEGQLRCRPCGLHLELQRRSGGKLLRQLGGDDRIADLERGGPVRQAADHDRLEHLPRLEQGELGGGSRIGSLGQRL